MAAPDFKTHTTFSCHLGEHADDDMPTGIGYSVTLSIARLPSEELAFEVSVWLEELLSREVPGMRPGRRGGH